MDRIELIHRIEHDNDRQVMFTTVMPHVIDILKKYSGKQYGEKTKEKMRNELKALCNCSFYLSSGYSEDISIVPLTTQGYSDFRFSYSDFRIYVKYPLRDERRPLSESNRICGDFELSDFYLSFCHEYVDDVEAHAEKILESFKALCAQAESFEDSIHVFNGMLPSQVEHKRTQGFTRYL